MNHIKLLMLAAAAWGGTAYINAETIQLQELNGTEHITCKSGENVRINKSTNNRTLTIEGTTYATGIGTHAPSVIVVELNGATSFSGIVGIDDEADIKADHGVVDYTITGYGETLADATVLATGNLNRQTTTYHADVNLTDLSGYRYLKFDFANGTKPWADHVDIVNATFEYSGERPSIIMETLMYVSATVELPVTGSDPDAQIVALSSLQIENITSGWANHPAKKDLSIDGNPLMMKGRLYTSGIGTHAASRTVVRLNGSSPRFHCELGIDDETKSSWQANNSNTTVGYSVTLRDKAGKETIVKNGTIKYSDAETVTVDLDNLTDYKYLILDFDNAGAATADHVDIANAYFEFMSYSSNAPDIMPISVLEVGLDAATTVFSQPGVRFMHKLRTPNPDATISVSNLPAGLEFNERRTLVEGIVAQEGTYTYNVTVELGEESTTTPVTLTVSSNLHQPTPFMGWLSWNSIEGNISEDVVKSVADQMVSKGLLDLGYNYLVMDDLWHASARAADGTPVEDPAKFPNGLKATSDYVHSKGLKFGIYSDAAEKTCAKAYGSLGYEVQDANQYAAWGVDLLKYDYCGAPTDVATARTRYTAMGNALKASGRDIVFYVCEWGVREPWKWGAEAGGTCWRVSYDTRDCWQGATNAYGIGIGILESIRDMKDIWHYSGVNRWNDADMMMTGIHGTGKSSSKCCTTGPGMTMDEYRTQFALWCMWQSPLTLSNDMSLPIADEDFEILSNKELIAIDQDRMGQSAETIRHDASDCLILAKDCENGDVVVSVTNLTATAKNYTLDLAQVSAADPSADYLCRDVVNHQDLEPVSGTVDFGSVPSHATKVYRLSLDKETGITATRLSEALDAMTVSGANGEVNVCLRGTAGTPKRILVSDVDGHIVAAANGQQECFTLAVPAHGTYIVHSVCAARAQSHKIIL